jgi:hypothetical protein
MLTTQMICEIFSVPITRYWQPKNKTTNDSAHYQAVISKETGFSLQLYWQVVE